MHPLFIRPQTSTRWVVCLSLRLAVHEPVLGVLEPAITHLAHQHRKKFANFLLIVSAPLKIVLYLRRCHDVREGYGRMSNFDLP